MIPNRNSDDKAVSFSSVETQAVMGAANAKPVSVAGRTAIIAAPQVRCADRGHDRRVDDQVEQKADPQPPEQPVDQVGHRDRGRQGGVEALGPL